MIAREVERRLLPRYVAALAEATERQAEYKAYVATIQRQAAELAALLDVAVSPDGGETQPRIYRYQRTTDDGLAVVQIQGGYERHRIELTLPHDEALAVVRTLVAVWG
ncbi:MAG: hypothetical protein KDD73_17030 [Anaerolineales bacterium]|nr:hypothetical protein [Anaerolineales bacterium]